MRVEVPDRQALHVLEHLVTDALHGSLCQEYLNELLEICGKEAARKYERNAEDIGRQCLGDRSAPFKRGSDVLVYKRLGEKHSLNGGLYRQEDAHCDKDPLEYVAFDNELHEPQEDLPGVLNSGFDASGGAIHRSRHQLLPLSSKSASAPVCDS